MKKIKNVLNLDPSFSPFDGSCRTIQYTQLQFNGGELHFSIDADQEDIAGRTIITSRIRCSSDIMFIALAVDALRRIGIDELCLFIPYVPYARQDRVANKGECFSLKVFANIINSLGFDKVYGIDVHSDVTPALINNFVNIKSHDFINQVLLGLANQPVLIAPDAGANKKVYDFRDNHSSIKQLEVIPCNKTRDTKTGKLNNFEVFADELRGQHCLIIDDICDGGATFIEIAKILKRKGAAAVYLYTTHGIYSQGLAPLLEHIDLLYCTDSYKSIEKPLAARYGRQYNINGTQLLKSLGERFNDSKD